MDLASPHPTLLAPMCTLHAGAAGAASVTEQPVQSSSGWVGNHVYVPIVGGVFVLFLLLLACGCCVLPLLGINLCASLCCCCPCRP